MQKVRFARIGLSWLKSSKKSHHLALTPVKIPYLAVSTPPLSRNLPALLFLRAMKKRDIN